MAEVVRRESRVAALDGLRGLMTILVVMSHFFAEVPHGLNGLMFGWIAVDMFYVLSGYLIGRLILEKSHHANFFTVFYLRRVCRTMPIYFFCVALILGTLALLGHPEWSREGPEFPLWAYLTFTQNFWMAGTGGIGQHWLAPTWTLALEEQFYVLAPALILLTPRRWLVPALLAAIAFGVVSRFYILFTGVLPPMAASCLLPPNADVLTFGILAAVLMASPSADWRRYDLALRAVPLALLLAAIALVLAAGKDAAISRVLTDFLVSGACAVFIMALVRDAPEAERFKSPYLRFFGTTSYAVYLTHLPVLGLMHGLILSARPDISTPAQWAVTLCALPVTVLAGWALTKFVEAPISAFGRSFNWSSETRAVNPSPLPGTAP